MLKLPIPVIDLFAGPGGLGEGFSALRTPQGKEVFRIGVSVEKDQLAHRTLLLRSFYRNLLRQGFVPEFYYEMIRNSRQDSLAGLVETSRDRQIHAAFTNAQSEALCLELGNPQADLVVSQAIAKAIQGYEDWVLIGGPPCQAYSLAGRSRNKGVKGYRIEDDHRSILYKEYLKVIAIGRPALFLMENVKGMISAKLHGRPVFNQIVEDLRKPTLALGAKGIHALETEYEIVPVKLSAKEKTNNHNSFELETGFGEKDYIVRCEEHGIPQHRHRLIVLGIRSDVLNRSVAWQKGNWRLNKFSGPTPSVMDVIRDLPQLTSYLSSRETVEGKRYKAKGNWKELLQFIRESAGLISGSENHWTNQVSANGSVKQIIVENMVNIAENFAECRNRNGSAFIPISEKSLPVSAIHLASWYRDERLQGYCNHECRSHMDKDLERYLFASVFAKAIGRSPVLDEFPPELQPRHKSAGTGHFNDRFRVQIADSPATTITSHISKDGHYFIHPDPSQCRSLTVREAARIQTFPDNYVFCGPRTSQFVQVGNAVPPFLAYQLAGCMWQLLNFSK